MIEIDWSSLFSSFFSMVRIKIACKDPTKIPKKRFFEMKNSLYVIYFKVEGSVEARLDDDDGGGGGGDNEDPGLGDDVGWRSFNMMPCLILKLQEKKVMRGLLLGES
jgi:hypothetical protein